MKKKSAPATDDKPPVSGLSRFPLGDVRSKSELLASLRRNYRLSDSSAAKLNLPSDVFVLELSDGSSTATIFSSSRLSLTLPVIEQMLFENIRFPHYFIAFYGNSSNRYFILNDPSRDLQKCVRLAGVQSDMPSLDSALAFL